MFGKIIDFLLALKQVHLGPNTRLSFAFAHPVLITLGVLLLLAVGYLSYMPQSASPAKKRVLGVLRAALLVLVLLLACQPELVMESDVRQPAVIAVWVDASASMTLEDPYTGAKAAPMKDYLDKITTELKAAASAPAELAPGQARLNRYQLAVATLRDAQWLRSLTPNQQILFFTGSGRAEPVGLASTPAEVDARLAQIAALKPDGPSTDVPTIVRDILERVQGQRLSALVLLTDGQTNEPGSRLDLAADQAQLAGVKVLAIPLGQEDEPFDLQLSNLRLPTNTFTRDPVSARIRVAGTGITGPTNVRINIYRKKPDGTFDKAAPLATRDVTLDRDKREVDTDVPIRLQKTDPGKSERFDLLARIEPIGVATPERTLANNEQARTVTVLDAQINALYVEGYPRWEFRYLKNELVREPTVNVSSLLLTADEGFVQDADPQVKDADGKEIFPGPITHFPDTMQDLSLYDVLIIGDVEPTYFSPLQQNLIVDWVKTKGGGVCFIAGSQYNPEHYRETPLEVLLPVVPDEIDPRARIVPPSDNMPFDLSVTPAGKETNLFRFFDDPDQSWKQVDNLPGMYWFKPVQGLKPGAIVLATNPSRSTGGSPAPMLVMRQFGAGPVIFSAYCDTWRWRRYTGEPLFQSYWLQMCRLLYANKALGQSKRLELAADATQVEIGGQLKLSLTVKDPTLNSQVPAEVPVMVVDKNGRTIQTITLAQSAGALERNALAKLTGSASIGQLGEFSLQVKPGTLPVEVTPLDLTVEQPQREFENVTMDQTGLEAITSLHASDVAVRGDVVPPYQQEKLAQEIPDRSVTMTSPKAERIWDKPLALLLVLALATAEWLVRKSAGLI